MEVFEDQQFISEDYIQKGIPHGAYEYCNFTKCNFSKIDLSQMRFIECVFTECDLSNITLSNTSLQGVIFQSCKMIGTQFDEINPFNFSASFEQCNLNHSTFYKMLMKKMKFVKCSFLEADFTEADCQGVIFDQCDFSLAHFNGTNLQNTDFSTSENYTISPISNAIKGATFSKDGIEGLLKVFGVIVK